MNDKCKKWYKSVRLRISRKCAHGKLHNPKKDSIMSKLGKFAAACAAVVVSVSAFGAGMTVYVNGEATPESPYDTEASGFNTLGDAIDYIAGAAPESATVVFCEGTYVAPQRTVTVPVRMIAAEGASSKIDFQKATYESSAPCLVLEGASSSIEGIALYRLGENSLYVKNGTRIVNCVAADAYTQTGGMAKGGAIYVQSGSVVDGCTFTNGAGSYVYGNPLVALSGGSQLINTTFADNQTREFLVTVSGAESLVSNCVFRANKFANAGGGNPEYTLVRLDSGLVTHCRFEDNGRTDGSYPKHGQVHLKSASSTLRNSLFVNNRGPQYAGIQADQGTVENCTVVGSKHNVDMAFTGMDIIASGSAVVRNCIFASEPEKDTVSIGGSAKLTYSFTYLPETGEGNITGLPHFNNAAEGDYTLNFISPCRNTGTNQAWMVGASDLAGQPRVVEEVVDMGCFEKEAMPDDYLECLLSAACTGVADDGESLTYRFTAEATRADATFAWFVDGVEQVWSDAVFEIDLASAADAHKVKVVATAGANSAAAEEPVSVAPTKVYCKAGNPNAAVPYDTEATAAASLADVLGIVRPTFDTRKMTVMLLAGEGPLPVHDLMANEPILITAKEGEAVQLDMQDQITGLTLNGANAELRGVEIVKAGEYAVKLNGGAKLTDVTVTKAHSTTTGASNKGVIHAFDGTVTNCRFDGCRGEYAFDNPVLWMANGTASGCVFENCGYMDVICIVKSGGTLTNSVFRNNGFGNVGMDYIAHHVIETEGLVVDCQILTNGTVSGSVNGHVQVSGGTVRNCFLSGNTAYSNPGFYLTGSGVIENCTVVGGSENTASTAGGLDLYQSAGTVRNCIFWSSSSDDTVRSAGGTIDHSLMPVLHAGEGNLATDPLFRNAPVDYTLDLSSPCRNKGANQAWMDGAKDLAGNDRIIDDIVDMGCFEGEALPDDYLACSLTTETVGAGEGEGSIVFRLTVDVNAEEPVCVWTIDGEVVEGESGVTFTREFAPKAVPYAVAVAVTAGARNGRATGDVSATPTDAYVSTEGSDEYPYDTPAKAAKTLLGAFSVARSATDPRSFRILVASGTYDASVLRVPRATTVMPLGDGEAVIRGTGAPAVTVDDAQSVIDGLVFTGPDTVLKVVGGTVRNCRYQDGSGRATTGIIITGGLVDGLVVSNFNETSWSWQRPVSIAGGTLQNFVIERTRGADYNMIVDGGVVSNGVIRNWAGGIHGNQDPVEHGGIKIKGGLVTHCVLANLGDTVTARSGTVCISGGTLRHCLVADNKSTDCAGINMSGSARVEHCTVVVKPGDCPHLTGYGTFGSVLNMNGGTVVNSVFAGDPDDEGLQYQVSANGTVTYSRADVQLAGEGNLTDDPQFGKRYVVGPASPCARCGREDGQKTYMGYAKPVALGLMLIVR